jgi:hypothetical protein
MNNQLLGYHLARKRFVDWTNLLSRVWLIVMLKGEEGKEGKRKKT